MANGGGLGVALSTDRGSPAVIGYTRYTDNMYRQKDRIRKKPEDTEFWQQAAQLKKQGFINAVHALASIDIQAYEYIIEGLKHHVSLEKIMSGLWREHKQALQTMKSRDLGTLSPNSLLTYKRKFFNRGRSLRDEMPMKKARVNNLLKQVRGLEAIYQKVEEVQNRVDMPTDIGMDLIQKQFDLNCKALSLQLTYIK